MNNQLSGKPPTDPLFLLRQEIAKMEAQHNALLAKSSENKQEAQLLLLRKAILSKRMELVQLRMKKDQ